MMVFQPGQSGNPNGYSGPRLTNRHKIHREILEETKELGHKDALITLSTIQNDETIDDSVRVSAAASLAPYFHPKLQSIPVPRFNPTPIDIPEFQAISDAERFLAKIAVLTARGELDFQSALELTTIAKTWIDARSTSEIEQRLLIIEQANGITHANGQLAVTGGLPSLPGTNITMPGDQPEEPPE